MKYKCPVCKCEEIYKHKTIGEYVDCEPEEVEISFYTLKNDGAKYTAYEFPCSLDNPDHIKDLPIVVICKNCGIVYKPKE